jgi:hypothetical protein
MTRNEILSRVYKLYPAIGAWASSSRLHWPDAGSAIKELEKHVGPSALDKIFECYHIRKEADRAFLRSDVVVKVVVDLVDALYHHRPLEGGLFPEDNP